MLFAHLRLKLDHLLHAAKDDVQAAVRWSTNHTIVPAAHLASGIGQTLGGFERFAEREVVSVAHGVRSTEEALIGGVEHAYRAIGTEVKGVGQVIGSIGHNLGEGAETASTVLRYAPLVLAGGAVIWVARAMA